MDDSISTSDDINLERKELVEPQIRLYNGIIRAESEAEDENNKYAVNVLAEHVGQTIDLLQNLETSRSRNYREDVIKPIHDECYTTINRSGKPSEEKVHELIGAVRHAINVYNDKGTLRMVDWSEYM